MKTNDQTLLSLLQSALRLSARKPGAVMPTPARSWRDKPVILYGPSFTSSSENSRISFIDQHVPHPVIEHSLWRGLSSEIQLFLAFVCSCSPYLRRVMGQSPSMLNDTLSTHINVTLSKILDPYPYTDTDTDTGINDDARYGHDWHRDDRLQALKKNLRRRKKNIALLLGLLDVSCSWRLSRLTETLSDFADAVCREAFATAIYDVLAIYTGQALHEDFSDGTDWTNISTTQNFLAVLAMGKHGAQELNYSSDIDITVFYDPDELQSLIKRCASDKSMTAARANQGRWLDTREIATKITQRAADILSSQNADGYVFRTDFRLRPNPGSTSLAVSLPAAEEYYEIYGQNWERAAFIKARPVFGGEVISERLSRLFMPFVWRRYLDFSAIQDVQAIKSQIHASKGGIMRDIAGHDIKLGRGGIREIEFFVQTQQLILGGKNERLQQRATLPALAALCQNNHITEGVYQDLTDAYMYLRHLEHRLQIVNDEQTHKIPVEPEELSRVVLMMGYEEVEEFFEDTLGVLNVIQNHYADLFDTENDDVIDGSLVFTGVDHDPQTLETLNRIGFSDARAISSAIMSWHKGAVRAARIESARALITKLVPLLLIQIQKYNDPDLVFEKFHKFIQLIPARVTVFSLFFNNPKTLRKVLDIINLSPRLSEDLARRQQLIEALLDDNFLLGDASSFEDDIADILENISSVAQADLSLEDTMNAVRRHASKAYFQISAQYLLVKENKSNVGRYFSDIADACITTFLPIARREMIDKYGAMPGALGVIAMGRLGVRALSAVSDIDIIFVYDAPLDAISDGKRGLDTATYYMRLVRTMITALTSVTEEGPLLDVDMQLRPSGGAGPAAVSLSAFEKYYAHNAWTWERMALTKARIVIAEEPIGSKLSSRLVDIMTTAQDEQKLKQDIREMRQKLLKAKPATSIWDVKNAQGGLTDIEFTCQFIQLRAAPVIGWAPRGVIEALRFFKKSGEVDPDISERLIVIYKMLDEFYQTARVIWGQDTDFPSLSGERADEQANEKNRALCAIFDAFDMREAACRLEDLYAETRSYFIDIIGVEPGAPTSE